MVFVVSLILYCTIGALGIWVCLVAWREGAIATPKVYRREEHYMRGPGPKWCEKHGSGHIPGVR